MTLARKALVALAFGVFALAGVPGAMAAVIYGTAVDDGNNDGNAGGFSTNTIGNTIKFYIPLSGSGTYGVGGFGTSASYSQCCGNGTMDMWLQFDGVTPGMGTLRLDFEDLDVDGIETPSGFLETVTVYANGGTSIVDDMGDLTNVADRVVEIAVGLIGDPFIVKLAFTADTTGIGYRKGTWLRNTAETLVASVETISTVPVPAALPLFGTALAAFGFMRLRRKTAAA